MSDAFLTLLGMNLVAAGAVALVMALRAPARRLFGARVAYGLWSLVPLAGLALLLPARVVTVAVPAAAQAAPEMIFDAGTQAASLPAAPGFLPFAAMLWAAGALVSLACLVWRQAEFARAARHGLAGPAVIGLLRPRIVTPFDFGWRYTPREQLVVLAHEATHIARRDTLVNAAVALAACVNWFNPAIHILARYLRIDQELACDAAVIGRFEAMLKTQLDVRPLPVGCYWPAQARHPLAERIRLLSRQGPGLARRRLGTAAVALLGLTAAWSAWAVRPAQVMQVPIALQVGATPPAPMVVAPAPPSPARKADAAVELTPAPVPAAADAPPAEPDIAPLAETATASPEAPPIKMSRIHAVARRSAVEPGSAVRVVATMIDPDGVPLITDLTAFGSQSAYRSGYFRRTAASTRYSPASASRASGSGSPPASTAASSRPPRARSNCATARRATSCWATARWSPSPPPSARKPPKRSPRANAPPAT